MRVRWKHVEEHVVGTRHPSAVLLSESGSREDVGQCDPRTSELALSRGKYNTAAAREKFSLVLKQG